MARAFVRVGLCLGLSSCLGLGSLPAAAQGSGDFIEDDSEPGQQQASDDQDQEGEDDAGDGDWSDEGGGASSGSGFHFGLRLGYGFALGKATKSSGSSTSSSASGDMADLVAGQIPIWVDLGWQFSPSFMLGAYFSYGFVLPKGDLADACDEARSGCTLSDIRLGLQGQLSFSPGRSTDPWIGAGVGYEWFTLNIGDATARAHGWEFLMLQAGLDFGGDSGGSTIGPFAAFTFGQFSQASFKYGSIDESGSIDSDQRAMHNWLFVGVRGVVK